MTCPRCKVAQDILRYVPLLQIAEYAHETTPIYKCPDCLWVFAPVDNVAIDVIERGLASAPVSVS